MNSSQPLQMFPQAWGAPPVGVEAAVRRRADRLMISFALMGDWTGLCLAARTAQPQRLDGLWRTTCFECFIAGTTSPAYWEINLAPSGHWQSYCFTAYRQGMVAEQLVEELSSAVTVAGQTWRIEGCLAGLPPLAGDRPLVAGLTCVLEDGDGRKSYWALCHKGIQPDFHQRQSWIVTL